MSGLLSMGLLSNGLLSNGLLSNGLLSNGLVLAEQVEGATGIETRTVKLGHVQRGGSPVPADRVLATEFGYKAIEILCAGERSRLVVMKGRTVTHIPLEEAEGKQRLVPVDHPLILAGRNVGTCFGD